MTPDEKIQVGQLEQLRKELMCVVEGVALSAKARGDRILFEELIYQRHKANAILFHIERLIGNPTIAYRGTSDKAPENTLGDYVKKFVDKAADKLRNLN